MRAHAKVGSAQQSNTLRVHHTYANLLQFHRPMSSLHSMVVDPLLSRPTPPAFNLNWWLLNACIARAY
jgi:hypothetical protein